MTDQPDVPAPSAVEGGRRSRAVRPGIPEIDDDAVSAAARQPSWPSTARLLMGYPPVLGVMLLIDGVVALAGGGRCRPGSRWRPASRCSASPRCCCPRAGRIAAGAAPIADTGPTAQHLEPSAHLYL